MTGHLLLALGLTLGLLGGVLGLGRLLGVLETPAAAVVGLHLLWWPAALAGALVSPAAGLHWACPGLAAAAAGLARRLGAGRHAWTAGLCTAASWHALWIAGVAAVGQVVVLAVAVAAAEMAALLAGEEERKAWTAGLALGLALAVKYTAAVPVAALLLALVVVRPRRWRWAVGAGVVAAGSSSFWYLRSLITTGNPVYPLFWGLLGGPSFRVLGWHDPAAAARWRRLLAVSRPVWRGRLLELRELP